MRKKREYTKEEMSSKSRVSIECEMRGKLSFSFPLPETTDCRMTLARERESSKQKITL
jgi:hypothetical protein